MASISLEAFKEIKKLRAQRDELLAQLEVKEHIDINKQVAAHFDEVEGNDNDVRLDALEAAHLSMSECSCWKNHLSVIDQIGIALRRGEG